MSDIKNVTIAGAGVMGSQISWQCAISGFDVTVYDVFDAGLEQGKKQHQSYAQQFVDENRATKEEADAALARISYTTDLETAFANADLVNESVPEDPSIKHDFWAKASNTCKPEAILTSNTSSFTPSQLVDAVNKPERFLTLHFWSGVWNNKIGEVMGHPGTDPKAFDKVVEFADAIGMMPIPIKKEQPGYVTNSLLIPWCIAALKLHFLGVSDYKEVDKVWMAANGGAGRMGPFAHMDTFGINVCYHIAVQMSAMDPALEGIAETLKTEYIDKGKMGAISGEGFYTYPNPEYLEPDFVKS